MSIGSATNAIASAISRPPPGFGIYGGFTPSPVSNPLPSFNTLPGFGVYSAGPRRQLSSGPPGFGVYSFGDRQGGTIDPFVQFDLAQRNAGIGLYAPFQQGGTGIGGGSTPMSGGAGWEQVNRWDAFISEASAATGVPANLIKAVMRYESNGDPDSVSVAGATGLMQVMPGIWNGAWGLSVYDPRQNVLLGANILKDGFDRYGDWDTALNAYLGFGPSDAYGTTGPQYVSGVKQYWNELNAVQGPQSGLYGGLLPGGGQGFGGGQFNAIFGGQQAPVSQEFGPTAFAQQNASWYAYGNAYGLQGSQHPGVDIAVPSGTALYAPMGGTVMTAGEPGGFYRFNGNTGYGIGELRLQLDNGQQLILGHMSQIPLQAGQRVEAGSFVGRSGSENGDHVHVELRVPDASLGSGWRIVDPRTALGGTFTGGGFGAPGTGAFGTGQVSGGAPFWKTMTYDQIVALARQFGYV